MCYDDVTSTSGSPTAKPATASAASAAGKDCLIASA